MRGRMHRSRARPRRPEGPRARGARAPRRIAQIDGLAEARVRPRRPIPSGATPAPMAVGRLPHRLNPHTHAHTTGCSTTR